MTLGEREQIEAVIASLEEAHTLSNGFAKATYSQGRAVPSAASYIQNAIADLKKLLEVDAEETVHITTLVSGATETAQVIAKEVARIQHGGKSK